MQLLERRVHVALGLGARDDDAARDEDEEDDLGVVHAVDQAGEELRLVGAEARLVHHQTLQADRESDVARRRHVLHLFLGIGVSGVSGVWVRRWVYGAAGSMWTVRRGSRRGTESQATTE